MVDPVQSLVASPELCHLSEVGERRCTTNVNSEANVNTELYTKTKEKRSNLIVKETKAEGAVKSKVCKKHFDMAVGGSRLGWWIICLLFCLYIVGQTIRVSIDLVFTVWSEAPAVSDQATLVIANNVTQGTGSIEIKTQASYIVDAAVLVSLNVIIALLRSCLGVYMTIRSSQKLHERVIHRLMKAPLLYFQQNPIGRILNRLSADLQKADTMLPNILYQMLDNAFTLASCYVLAGISCVYVFLIILPVIVVYRFIFMMYRSSGREIQRMDAISRSPINVAFDQALQSKETIRAYNVVEYFVRDAQCKCDSQARFFLLDTRVNSYQTSI